MILRVSLFHIKFSWKLENGKVIGWLENLFLINGNVYWIELKWVYLLKHGNHTSCHFSMDVNYHTRPSYLVNFGFFPPSLSLFSFLNCVLILLGEMSILRRECMSNRLSRHPCQVGPSEIWFISEMHFENAKVDSLLLLSWHSTIMF